MSLVHSIRKIGPLFNSTYFHHVKDPAICYDGKTWHIFGTGAGPKPGLEIVHATAPHIEGPWTEIEPVVIQGMEGAHVAAPSVMYEEKDGLYHMALQQDYTKPGGGIEYLTSGNGNVFSRVGTLLSPTDDTEIGLYDPHFSEVGGVKYTAYAGMRGIKEQFEYGAPQPDIYLARSKSDLWSGPWERVRRILSHEDIAWHHNQIDNPDYEWGIEGPQIVELPDGTSLLLATSFLPEGARGTRQRAFFALAEHPEGPYTSIGPVIDPEEEWESGENGHASAYVLGDELYLFYQARSKSSRNPNGNRWLYGLAIFSIEDIQKHM